MTREQILAPYAELLEILRDENTRMLEINKFLGRSLTRYQRKRLDAEEDIKAWMDELVINNGDITKCGEIPREQWTANNGTLAGWLGKDVRARIVVYLPDGSPFLAIPRSPFISDAQYILQGGKDPSGESYRPYNRVLQKDGTIKDFPCWNSFELTDAYNPTDSNDDLDLIRNFDLSKGTLRSDPQIWKDPFKAAWFEGHPV